jgi:toxin HigB-1
VQELVAGRPHPLKGDRAGQFALDLDGGKRLVFEPANEPIPYKQDGSIDGAIVTHICIVFIGDYHD